MGTARGVPRAHAHGGAHGRSRGGRLRGAVALVGRGPGGLLGRDLAPLRSRRRLRPRARRAVDAGRRVVPGHDAQLRRAPVPRQARRPHGDPPRLGAARPGVLDLGRAARADGRDPRRARGARRRAGRPRRRLPAERARDARGLPRHRVAGRRVVLGGARVRRAQRLRPVRADRAEGAARHRRLPLRRTRLRPPRGGRRDRRRGRRAGRAARVPRRHGLGGRVPASRRAGVRAGRLRSPALGPLLVRHDRAAEGDRPGAGRDPARAPEDDVPAPGLPRGRPGVLVHHDGLDDVELPRLRPAHRRGDRPLRRQPGDAGHEPRSGTWPPRRGSRASGRARATSPRA